MKKIVLLIAMTFSCIFSTHKNVSALGFNALISPYPILTQLPNDVKITKKDVECPAPPKSIKDMLYNSVYTDRTNGVSIVDKDAKKKYKAAISDITTYERQISKWIDTGLYGNAKTDEPIKCALEWLNSWANERSMLDGDTNFQGEAMRKWTLGVVSSHYLQIKYLRGLDKNKKRNIEKWIGALGHEVMNDYKRYPKSRSRHNNHMYWAAWGVMVSSVVLDNKNYYKWAEREYKKGIKQIQEDGLLPHEIFREGKAFNYHIFAAAPLVMMAETMAINGHNMYEYNNGALHRLINIILEELDNNQAYLQEVTGVKQSLNGTITSGMLAWLEIYNARYEDTRAKKWLEQLRPMKQRRIGGNITHIFAK